MYNAEIRNEGRYISTPFICLHGAVRDSFVSL
jgi:hypothetical protein